MEFEEPQVLASEETWQTETPAFDQPPVQEEAPPAQEPTQPEPPAGRDITSLDVLKGFGRVCHWLYVFRSVFLAIPVVIAMVFLARYGWTHLPAEVGLMVSTDGGFEHIVTRDQAVWGCVAVTSACLLMMFCSRKTLYPWLISVVSLGLPVLILFLNLVLIA